MTVIYMPNGPGELLGDRLATGVNLTRLPLVLSAAPVAFVGSTNASDAQSGRDPLRPLATIAQAQTNAEDDDIIVLMDGYSTTEALTISKQLIFAASGQSAGLPTVRWNLSATLTVSASQVEFRNIKFTAPIDVNASPRFIITGGDCLFRGCYFELNGNDAGSSVIRLDDGSTRARFEQCTFVVTSTSPTSRPPAAIYRNGTAVSLVNIIDCTFDGGTVGFDTAGGTSRLGYCIDGGNGTGTTKWRIQNLTLLRGPDISMPANAIGHVQIQTNTGGSKLFAP